MAVDETDREAYCTRQAVIRASDIVEWNDVELKYTNFHLLEEGANAPARELAVSGGTIRAIGEVGSLADGELVEDLQGKVLSAGLIDLQVNGAGDALFQTEPTVETLRAMASALAADGVTAFLPTLTPADRGHAASAIDAIRAFAAETPSSVLGINLEGPFINPDKAGMATVGSVGFDEDLLSLLAGFEMPICMTIAPEALGEDDAVRLVEAGVTLSLGHTTASYEEAVRYLKLGARGGTHIFNAMTGIAGRDPGLAGALLNDEKAFASLIADGYHVHAANVRLAETVMEPDRLFLISDGMPPLGGTTSTFKYGSHTVTAANGRCTTENGVLAGTAVPIAQGLRNVSEWTGIALHDLIPMATRTPAEYIGEPALGRVEPGSPARFAIWEPDLLAVAALIPPAD